MRLFASNLVRGAALAVLLSAAALAGNAADASSDGDASIASACATATTVEAGSGTLSQWGPRQCCRRVGLTYQCGPC